MFGTLIKKRLTDEKVANIFVNAILDVTEKGFEEVAGLIKEDSAFVHQPQINVSDNGKFTMIVLAGNLKFLEDHFEADQVARVEELIFDKFAGVFGISASELKQIVKEYDHFMARVNHPSKNTLYAMSKAVFHKYNLNDYQDDYFRKMQCPNPLFLKRMDDVMTNFVWDWNAFFKRYKLIA
ncbi:hypothetical protein GCM10009118_28180 [Wandonia haliotis]|uniref:Uncharacterized protein n=1 Tax=Wandonia haliotis TaxID=574963 RepID=A0ABP3Y6J1_9FLAO